MLDIHNAVGTYCPLADERDGGIDGHTIKPGVGELVFSQGREAAPDLKEDFLVQVVLVSRVPRINAADPENPISILVHQL